MRRRTDDEVDGLFLTSFRLSSSSSSSETFGFLEYRDVDVGLTHSHVEESRLICLLGVDEDVIPCRFRFRLYWMWNGLLVLLVLLKLLVLAWPCNAD